MNSEVRVRILAGKLDLLGEAFKGKEKLEKKMKDDLLRQKFEIQRLNRLISEKLGLENM